MILSKHKLPYQNSSDKCEMGNRPPHQDLANKKEFASKQQERREKDEKVEMSGKRAKREFVEQKRQTWHL